MRRYAIAVSALVTMGLVGCSGGGNPMSMAGTAGKAAFKAVRGAEAEATTVKMPSSAALAEYRTLVAGEVTTDVPPICTPDVLSKVRKGIREGVDDKDLEKAFPGGGDKTLRFDVQCRLYKEKGMLGGEGRLDWVVMLIDVQTGEEVGRVFIEGVSESALKHGAADMAKENTQELIKFLRKYKENRD